MLNILRKFRRAETGAVTVDWVVLTGAIVGLGVAVVVTILETTAEGAEGLGAHLEDQSVKSY
jgi:Flp pilus assembly pilin Flp